MGRVRPGAPSRDKRSAQIIRTHTTQHRTTTIRARTPRAGTSHHSLHTWCERSDGASSSKAQFPLSQLLFSLYLLRISSLTHVSPILRANEQPQSGAKEEKKHNEKVHAEFVQCFKQKSSPNQWRPQPNPKHISCPGEEARGRSRLERGGRDETTPFF